MFTFSLIVRVPKPEKTYVNFLLAVNLHGDAQIGYTDEDGWKSTGIKVFRHRAGFPACSVWLRKKNLIFKKKKTHVSISSPSLSSL